MARRQLGWQGDSWFGTVGQRQRRQLHSAPADFLEKRKLTAWVHMSVKEGKGRDGCCARRRDDTASTRLAHCANAATRCGVARTGLVRDRPRLMLGRAHSVGEGERHWGGLCPIGKREQYTVDIFVF
ncbi:unnamed protein product [Miscanthus lutarioriparius]|uniref:Uncharacterized protein n=1 Tax=Miscanthus lutarioriparius TaxID=422564 RepID=A0A811N3Z6_9POAL|nr:unnamed protein product [Miscanthus lutarioriparius]